MENKTRETTSIEVGGKTAVMYSYMTGGEALDLQEFQGPEVKKTILTQKIIETMVVSYGEETDKAKIFSDLRNLPLEQFSVIVKKLEEITKGIDKEEGNG